MDETSSCDSGRGFVIELVTAVIVLANLAYNAYQLRSEYKMKNQAPEEKQQFNGKYALILEETFKRVDELSTLLEDMSRDLEDLREWHLQKTPDGRPIWYFPYDEFQQLKLAVCSREAALVASRTSRSHTATEYVTASSSESSG